MTELAYAARNYLLQQSSVTSLIGDDANGEWIFVDRPEARVENSQTSLIVITTEGGWGANEHNTARFPTLVVDIWSDPERDPATNAVISQDAKLKAEAVYKAIDKVLHQVHNARPGGASVMWGTAEQITNKTGVRIVTSSRTNEPDYRPTFDNAGGVIATIRYNLSI